MVKKNCSGQAWVETVIYTLIAFVIIGLVLSFALPKIQQIQDQAIIQQSTDMMKQIDSTITGIGATGNQRILEISIKKGDLIVDGINNQINFSIESQAVYSEPGVFINDGSVKVLTTKQTGYNLVTLTLDYSPTGTEQYNLQFDGNDEVKTISKASTAYKLSILNKGSDANGQTILDFSLG